MKKTNFTFVKAILKTALSIALFFAYSSSYAQTCTLACNDAVNISVSASPVDVNSCDVEISADMILENYESALLNCEVAVGVPAVEADFIITLMNGPLVIAEGPSPLLVSGDDYTLGNTYITKVTLGSNTCWGTAVIEDKSAPVLQNCAGPFVVNCTQDIDDAALVGIPTAEDNCTNATVELIDMSTNTADLCGAGVVVSRTYIAIDGEGNISQPCTQNITIQRVTGVDFPEDIAWYCEDYAANNNIIDAESLTCTGLVVNAALGGVLDATDSPGACLADSGSGLPSVAEGQFCNFAVSHSDNTLTVCTDAQNSFKIIRTWSVLDWCTNSIVQFNDLNGNGVQDDADEAADAVDYNGDGDMVDVIAEEDNVQVIKVIDNAAPTITFAANADFELSANVAGVHPQPCKSQDVLPVPTVADGCSSVTWTVFTPIGEATFNNGVAQIPSPGLPIGTYGDDLNGNGVIDTADEVADGVDYNGDLDMLDQVQETSPISYVATDACGNETEVFVLVTIVDDITPSPVCDEITTVSIGGGGTAVVLAETFDDGSNDNCGIASFEVRRMTDNCGITGNTAFGPSVQFCCEDIQFDANGDEVPVLVAFRVYDYQGLFNDCMVQVLVEDNINPTVATTVADMTIDCDDYFDNIDGLLDIAETNGDSDPAILNTRFGTPSFNDNCAVTVTTSYARSVNSCGIGTITRTFTGTDARGGSAPVQTQTITVNHVNDWSIQFPENVELNCVEGMDELSGQDLGEPNVMNEGCELVAIASEDVIFNVVADACYKIIRTYTAINWCVYNGANFDDDLDSDDDADLEDREYQDGGDGIITYAQSIKVIDSVQPVIAAIPASVTTNPNDDPYTNTNRDILFYKINGSTDADGNCRRDITLPTATATDCSENVAITYELVGVGTGPTYTDLAQGTYTAIVTAEDNCGNVASLSYEVVIEDDKAPTPYCIGGLTVELMPVDADNDGTVDSGMVELWASDLNVASSDNCTADADLQLTASVGVDDFAASSANFTLTCDNITDTDNSVGIYLYIKDAADNVDYCFVTITLESVSNVCPTGDNGGGGQDELTIGGAIHNENDEGIMGAMVEVNSGSMDMISTDEAGNFTLSVTDGADVTITPSYDANYTEGVTTYDIVLIRKHILTSELLDSPYKMIAADVNNSGSITASDLVALKSVILGMNDSFTNNTSWTFVDAAHTFAADWNLQDGYPAVANINNISESATVDFMAVKVGDVNGSWTGFTSGAEERHSNTMTIEANNAKLLAGQEYTVEFTSEDFAALGYQFTLNYNNLEVVEVIGNQDDFGMHANAITTSWAGENATDKLFAVTFKATADVEISEALSIDSRITKAEAYDTTGEAMNVALEFNNTAEVNYALLQNTPNPVITGSTLIGFEMAQAGTATLTVRDVTGKIINIISGDYAKGYNAVQVNGLNTPSVMTYTLECEGFTATRKLIVQ